MSALMLQAMKHPPRPYERLLKVALFCTSVCNRPPQLYIQYPKGDVVESHIPTTESTRTNWI